MTSAAQPTIPKEHHPMTTTEPARTVEQLTHDLAELRSTVADLIDRIPVGVQPGSPADHRHRQERQAAIDARITQEEQRREATQQAAREARDTYAANLLTGLAHDPHLATRPPGIRERALFHHLATAKPMDQDEYDFRKDNPGRQVDGCCEFCCRTTHDHHSASGLEDNRTAQQLIARALNAR